MSTIPGGCFVAPDSLRRLNQLQKQHAREAKMQQTGPAQPTPPLPPGSPLAPRSVDHARSSKLTNLITIPLRLSEIIGRTRSMTSPQSTPPGTPPQSPRLPRTPSQEALDFTKPIDVPKSNQGEEMGRSHESYPGSI